MSPFELTQLLSDAPTWQQVVVAGPVVVICWLTAGGRVLAFRRDLRSFRRGD